MRRGYVIYLTLRDVLVILPFDSAMFPCQFQFPRYSGPFRTTIDVHASRLYLSHMLYLWYTGLQLTTRSQRAWTKCWTLPAAPAYSPCVLQAMFQAHIMYSPPLPIYQEPKAATRGHEIVDPSQLRVTGLFDSYLLPRYWSFHAVGITCSTNTPSKQYCSSDRPISTLGPS